MIHVRRLNSEGIKQLEGYLISLASETSLIYPERILRAPETSEDIGAVISIEKRKFVNRLEAAGYLYARLAGNVANIENDRGLWAWLALFYFNELCPPDRGGRRNPGDIARWIPDTGNFRKYYRHLLAGPYRIYSIYQSNPDLALILLCQPLFRPGEIVEQIASRQEMITNGAVVEAATRLYYDGRTMGQRRGASGKGPGSSRRFVEILNQFDVTWDLYSMNSTEIISMLPGEFSRFATAGLQAARHI